MTNKRTFLQVCGALALLCAATTHAAETGEVRMSRGLSLGFLPSIVMEDQKLVEKHTKAAGLGDVKVSWRAFIGGVAMNDALIAGQVDFAGGGPPPFLVLWARTQGTPSAVKAVAAMSSSPMHLLTRNPAIKSLRDFGPNDRISTPGAKISNQAVVLQMAAEKTFGDATKLDPLTVTLSLPDGFAAMISKGEVNSQFSGPPFQYQTADLEKNGIRSVLNSDQVMGGPTTFLMMWTSARFHDANPRTYRAVVAALQEAIDLINRDRKTAAEIFLRVTRQKVEHAEVVRILSLPEVRYTLAPENVMRFAEFLGRTGVIKAKPASWKDLFFPGPVHELSGS
jgi:NitT/TauT family transport system substrate-binding protein